jgi:ABC-2 type transport system permease protein
MRIRENWTAFYTLFYREFTRIMRIWSQTLLPPVITMALYFVIFGSLIGPRIGVMNGIPYIEYIVPGLVMMAIINNSYLNVVSSFFGNKFQRNIEEMLVAPMPNSIILSGYVSGGIIRGLIVGLLVILVSLFFTRIEMYHWGATFLIAVFTAVCFSLAGFINGIFAKKFDDISIIPLFILTPLTYLGGVFYSIDLLPKFWQAAMHLNPIFYMVNGFRYGMLGKSDVMIEYALLMLGGSVVILYCSCLWLLNRGIGVRS